MGLLSSRSPLLYFRNPPLPLLWGICQTEGDFSQILLGSVSSLLHYWKVDRGWEISGLLTGYLPNWKRWGKKD